ncbi:hypothetical protein XENTR_v10018251 [Xenopus tropicalis]|nr:hypothetical protein XENTR_v10018251 [Xenopus tropicalis]
MMLPTYVQFGERVPYFALNQVTDILLVQEMGRDTWCLSDTHGYLLTEMMNKLCPCRCRSTTIATVEGSLTESPLYKRSTNL